MATRTQVNVNVNVGHYTRMRSMTDENLAKHSQQEVMDMVNDIEEGAKKSPMHALSNGLGKLGEQWKRTKESTDKFILEIANNKNVRSMVNQGPEELKAVENAVNVALAQRDLVQESLEICDDLLKQGKGWEAFYRSYRLAHRQLKEGNEAKTRKTLKLCHGRVPKTDLVHKKLQALQKKWYAHSERLETVSAEWGKLAEIYQKNSDWYWNACLIGGAICAIGIFILVCALTGGLGGVITFLAFSAETAAGGAALTTAGLVTAWVSGIAAGSCLVTAAGCAAASISASEQAKKVKKVGDLAGKSAKSSESICKLTQKIKILVREQGKSKADIGLKEEDFNPTIDQLFDSLEAVIEQERDAENDSADNFDVEELCGDAIQACKALHLQVLKLEDELSKMGCDDKTLRAVRELRAIVEAAKSSKDKGCAIM